MSIVSRLINNPEAYSVDMLRHGVQSGTIPPYIGIPLIQEKIQEEKEARGAQGAGAKPTVAEQVMAQAQQVEAPRMPQQMPPVRSAGSAGIEGLRSNLPTEYAEGGIVAFGDGGEVERYQNKGYVYETPYDRMNRLNRERGVMADQLFAAPTDPQALADRSALMDMLRRGYAAATDVVSLPARGIAGAFESAVTRPLRAVGVPIPYLPREFYGPAGDPTSMTPYYDVIRKEDAAAQAAAQPEPAAQPAPQKAPAATGTGLGGESAAGRSPGLGLQPSMFPAAPYTQSATDVFQRQWYGTETEPGFLARSTARQAALDRKVQEAEGQIKGKAYEGLEADLKKEAQELGADKEQAKYMAMFKAGLAMMSGTSRFAAENIGKGALVGAEDYQKAAADIKKAHKENQKVMANIEQARRAEDIGNRDRAIARMDKVFEAEQKRDEFFVNGLTNAGIKDADRKLEEWKTLFGGEKAVQVAQIGAGATLGAAKLRNEALAARGAGITPYQLAQLRAKAQTRVDPEAVRAEIAKSLRLSKTPAAGVDAAFDKRVAELYARRVDDLVASQLGGSTGAGATSFAGFKLLGPDTE